MRIESIEIGEIGLDSFGAFIERIQSRVKAIGMEFKFLEVKDGKPYIPESSVLERVFMPWNKRYESDVSIYKFLNDIMPSLATPGFHLIVYSRFYAQIHNKVIPSEIIKASDVYRLHSIVFDKMMKRKAQNQFINLRPDKESMQLNSRRVADYLNEKKVLNGFEDLLFLITSE